MKGQYNSVYMTSPLYNSTNLLQVRSGDPKPKSIQKGYTNQKPYLPTKQSRTSEYTSQQSVDSQQPLEKSAYNLLRSFEDVVLQSPRVTQLQGEIEYWEIRYAALEKQYSLKIAAELELQKKQSNINVKEREAYRSIEQQKITIQQQENRISQLQKEADIQNCLIDNQRTKINDLEIQLIQSQEKELDSDLQLEQDEQITKLNLQLKQSNEKYEELQKRERNLTRQVSQYIDEISSLTQKLEQLNISSKFEGTIEKILQEKQNAVFNFEYINYYVFIFFKRLKCEEYKALKKVTKDKDKQLEELRLQLNASSQEILNNQAEIDKVKQRLRQNKQLYLNQSTREKELNQFKSDVQSEVQERIGLLTFENDTLKEQLQQKNVIIQRLQSLKPSIEKYQKDYVIVQLELEKTIEREQQLKKVFDSLQKDYELSEIVSKTQQEENEVRIKQIINPLYYQRNLTQANTNLTTSLSELNTNYSQLYEEYNLLSEQSSNYQDLAENWKQKFVQMNKTYHHKLEDILLLETEVQALRQAQTDSFSVRG